jgi:predicted dehydrogenase
VRAHDALHHLHGYLVTGIGFGGHAHSFTWDRKARWPGISGRDALGTMAVLDAARASAESGKSVEIEPAAIA